MFPSTRLTLQLSQTHFAGHRSWALARLRVVARGIQRYLIPLCRPGQVQRLLRLFRVGPAVRRVPRVQYSALVPLNVGSGSRGNPV
jgi:hypothetical protein